MPKLENLADQIYCNSDNKPKVASEFGKFDSRTAAQDRPGLLLRVFCLEIQNLLKILKDGCFGCLEALLYRIECQKRGFTACIYINILLWLSHDAISVTFFSISFAYSVPNPSFISITLLPLYFRRLSQTPSDAGYLSWYEVKTNLTSISCVL